MSTTTISWRRSNESSYGVSTEADSQMHRLLELFLSRGCLTDKTSEKSSSPRSKASVSYVKFAEEHTFNDVPAS